MMLLTIFEVCLDDGYFLKQEAIWLYPAFREPHSEHHLRALYTSYTRKVIPIRL